MTKKNLLIGLLLLSTSSAFAACGDASPDKDFGEWVQCELEISAVVTLAGPGFWTSTSQGMNNNREAYIDAVREDAAAYVASNGMEAADSMLQDAMNQIREKAPNAKQMSDVELAKLVEADLN